jgi:uncharacterized protein (DUF2164 family)
MRSQLSHAEGKFSSQAQSAKITLKIMNIVAKELGPVFLQQGIWLKSQTLREFIERRMDEFKAGCMVCELDRKPIEFTSLTGIDWRDDMVLLQVYSEALDRATQ